MFLADPSVTVYTGATLLAVLSLYLIHTATASPLRHIPGPWYTLLTHLPLKYHVLAGRRMYFVHSLHTRHGPVVRISPYEVAVADPEGFSTIHRIGGGFLKSPWYEDSNAPPEAGGSAGSEDKGGETAGRTRPFEPSIFAMSDPKQHALRRRRLLSRVFTRRALRRDWESVVRQNSERAVFRIRDEAKGWGCSDILKWWTMMATDTVAHLAFGESFNTLELGEKNDYMKMLELISIQNTIRYELPWLYHLQTRFPSIFKSSSSSSSSPSSQAPDAQTVLTGYAKRAVANLRKHNNSESSSTDNRTPNLFAGILDACEDDERDWLTEPVVEAEAKSMIIGGTDTTTVTLTYLVWAVLRRPGLQARLEEEVAAGLGEDFDDAALEKLPLLNAVFDETRFLDPSRQLTPQQKLLFSPFGAGTRICLGIELARMELRLGAALLFRGCRGLRPAPGMTDAMMEMENFFLVNPAGHKCEVTLP